MTQKQGCCPPGDNKSSCGCKTDKIEEIKPSCCPPKKDEGCGCTPKPKQSSCCPPKEPHVHDDDCGCGHEHAKPQCHKNWAIFDGEIATPAGPVKRFSHNIKFGDVLGRWLVQWGFGRDTYTVAPGLYAMGTPDASSPVLVTANYKLTVDLLRDVWKGINAWILVIDTYGINVWCAAGKGTFGTDELLKRIDATGLSSVVSHRELIVPQLGAPGVSGFEVKKASGFSVVYGPVRAHDLKAFLDNGKKADAAMRRVTFGMIDRLILTPLELIHSVKHCAYFLLFALLISGLGPMGFSAESGVARAPLIFAGFVAGILGGDLITPVLLPLVPSRMFSVKGALIGCLLGFLAVLVMGAKALPLEAASTIIVATVVSSFMALNFTGCTTYTSPSGVEKEMRMAIPAQALMAVVAVALWIYAPFAKG